MWKEAPHSVHWTQWANLYDSTASARLTDFSVKVENRLFMRRHLTYCGSCATHERGSPIHSVQLSERRSLPKLFLKYIKKKLYVRRFQAVDVPFHLILRTHSSLQSPGDSDPSKDPDHCFGLLGNSRSVHVPGPCCCHSLSSPLLQCSAVLACREQRVTNVGFWG